MKNIDLTEVLAAARGEVPADIVLKGGCIFNSFTGEWEIGDVAIVGETIATAVKKKLMLPVNM